MKTIRINEKVVPAVAQGCMRFAGMSVDEVEKIVENDLENGITFFDHADIYGGGECESLFGEVLKRHPDWRQKMIIQTKCGIHRDDTTYYDFDKDYIIKCVNESLERLNVEYVDYLLLHRPDALMEPRMVSEAFDELYETGKVLHFGVSNHNTYQLKLLRKYCHCPIEINQMQFSLKHTGMIDAALNANTLEDRALDRDGEVLDYCRIHNITIQCWSPFQYGMFEGTYLDAEKFPELNKKIDELANKYHVSNSVIAIAWILRHPSDMQVVVGTTNIDRLTALSKTGDIVLTKKEWYALYIAAGNLLP
ncbi:MAG: aldo/keto reductase [Erysipelotrichaceae bacterium]